MTYMARRGVHTETLREATLIRLAQDCRATIFFDCLDFWSKALRSGCEDIILLRFERGARVPRMLYPDRGPFADTAYYDVFGATLVASNENLGHVLGTRCVAVAMPLAAPNIEYPVPDERALLPLRERATAWRARQMLARWQPPALAKPAASRLGDALLPLLQIVHHMAPEYEACFPACWRGILRRSGARIGRCHWKRPLYRRSLPWPERSGTGSYRWGPLPPG